MKLRLLDLFCCQGGAGVGYSRAGFEIVGIDQDRQPRYPFAFFQADITLLSVEWVRANGFDAIHASPPCQGYSAMRHAPGAVGAPLLIDQTRDILNKTGLPWIIENVEEARWAMRDPVMLCGTSFGLGTGAHELQRHRLFESNIPLVAPPCNHSGGAVVGVYGGHARCRSARHGGRSTKDVWPGGHAGAASEALGIDWMTLGGMSESIPPIYTEFLGRQLMAHVRRQKAAA